MYISEIVEINNYRNLTGKTITFNDTLNFLIGENNIGKTNILELMILHYQSKLNLRLNIQMKKSDILKIILM